MAYPIAGSGGWNDDDCDDVAAQFEPTAAATAMTAANLRAGRLINSGLGAQLVYLCGPPVRGRDRGRVPESEAPLAGCSCYGSGADRNVQRKVVGGSSPGRVLVLLRALGEIAHFISLVPRRVPGARSPGPHATCPRRQLHRGAQRR